MKWLALFFTIFILLIIVLADLGRLGFLGVVNSIPYGDKAGHFILYGVLTLLIDLSLFRSLRDLDAKVIALRVALILALLIGLEEYSQQFFANRTFSLLDLSFSYLGVALFSWVALRKKQ
jgi:VanZ family protein